MFYNKIRSWMIVTFAIATFMLSGCVDSSTYSGNTSTPTFQQIFDVPGAEGSTNNASNFNDGKQNTYKSHKWAPPVSFEGKRRWDGIIIHHSATDFGDATSFDISHKRKGWDELGYHFVIDNGKNSKGNPDGLVEVGSRWLKQKHGAHCRVSQNDDNYWNEHYIGICLVGNFEKQSPTYAQYRALQNLVYFLKERYNIPSDKIIGHKDADPGTLCPGKLFNWKIANIR